MTNDPNRPILYIDNDTTPECQEAKQLLEGAGFIPEVKIAPRRYRAAYGTPLLFGLFNRFEGVDGVRIFLRNASRPQRT
jgi:hypothetical protein